MFTSPRGLWDGTAAWCAAAALFWAGAPVAGEEPAAPAAAVSAPTISPEGGRFCRVPVSVKMATATPAAVIRYTLDGTEPTPTAKRYMGTFGLSRGATVTARAFKDGMADSPTTSAAFTIEPALIYDPLKGQTVGSMRGKGEFVPTGGWRSQGGLIVYECPQPIENGYVEVTVTDFKVPGAGVDKTHPLAGWETKNAYGHYMEKGAFFNWRIGKGYECFKVLAASKSIGTRVEGRVGNAAEANDPKPHVWRVEWKDAQLTFLLDGKELTGFKMDRFQVQYFTLGHDLQYGAISNPAPTFSEFKIIDRGSNTKKASGDGTAKEKEKSAAWEAAFSRVLNRKAAAEPKSPDADKVGTQVAPAPDDK